MPLLSRISPASPGKYGGNEITYTNNSQNLFVKILEIISIIKLYFSLLYKIIQKYIILKNRVNLVLAY